MDTIKYMEIAQYLCRTICYTHTAKHYYVCTKHHPALYLCAVCTTRKIHTYQYICSQCQTAYCISHYLHHQSRYISNKLVWFYKKEAKTLCFIDIIEKSVAYRIKLAKSFNAYSELVIISNKVYITGGFPLTSDTIQIEIRSQKISQKPPMLYKKYGHCLCSIHSTIFSIGGFDEKPINLCEKYLIDADKWTGCPKMNFTRMMCASVVHKCYVYAFCGYMHSQYLNSIERMGLSSGPWELMNINGIRNMAYTLSVCSDNKIYLIGGYNGISY